MPSALEVLARYKDRTKRRFMAFVGRAPAVPADTAVPTDAAAALRLGIQIGRREGYGEGLVDGTALGLDVGFETVDAMMSQPVIFGAGVS